MSAIRVLSDAIPARCAFTDYPALMSDHHLRLVQADYVDGEAVAYFEPQQPALPGLPPVEPPAEPAPAPKPPAPRKPSKLALTLAGMLSQAAARPGAVKTRNLFHGLRVDLMVGVDGTTRLMIARRGVYPSDAEWITILSYWPYDVGLDAVPEKFDFKEWRCMRACWPTPEAQP